MKIENEFVDIKYFIIIALICIGFSHIGCKYDQPLPPATCDTTIVTYSGTIKPILTANCTRCHVGPNAPNGNGILLDDYVFVKRQVPQPLLDAINHTGNVAAMPKNANKLDACSIAKITKWIAQGATPN